MLHSYGYNNSFFIGSFFGLKNISWDLVFINQAFCKSLEGGDGTGTAGSAANEDKSILRVSIQTESNYWLLQHGEIHCNEPNTKWLGEWCHIKGWAIHLHWRLAEDSAMALAKSCLVKGITCCSNKACFLSPPPKCFFSRLPEGKGKACLAYTARAILNS